MTTIVASVPLGCIAADQRCTGDGPMCHVQKLHRIGDSVFGVAGDAFMALALIDWLKTPKRDRMKLYKMLGEEVAWRYEILLLELSSEGLALWNAWGLRMPILDQTYGVGTGAPYALEALDNNQPIDEAIRKAAKRDEYSGVFLEPAVEYLLPPELRTKRKRG